MPRPLSSSLTTGWKFILPAVWIVGFGSGVVASWLCALSGRGNEAVVAWMRWGLLAGWVAGSLGILWFSRRICHVSVSEDSLFASNFSRQIAVPLSAILQVSQTYTSRPQTITIYLDRKTVLGNKIVFIPHGFPHNLSKHPVTDQLLAIVERFHPAPPVCETIGTPWAENPGHTFHDDEPRA